MALKMASSARRYRQNRRRQTAAGALGLIKMAIVMAVLVLLVLLGIRLFNGAPSADTFCEGVYVGGISLGGMTYQEGVTAVNELVDERINQDTYTLTYEDKSWTFTPSEFGATLDLTAQLNMAWNFGHTGTTQERREQAAALKAEPVYYDQPVSYDEEKLDAFIAGIKAEIDREAVSAGITVVGEESFTISQSSYGLELSAEELKNTLVNSLLSGSTQTIQLTPTQVKPQYTTEELQANTQLIVSYRTKVAGSSSNRKRNVRRALQSFNNLVIYPGQVISFNDTVGVRTKANGFYEAPEYDFNEVTTGIGGGTCQAATTLYGAVLLANLDVVVRGNHSMTVDYVDASMDAAVSASKDFRFANNLDYPVYISTMVTDNWATVKIYGPPCEYEIRLENEIISTFEPKGRKFEDDTSGQYVYYVDEEPVLKTEGKPGMKSQGFRVYYDRVTGEEVMREDFEVDTYYAAQPVYWRGVHPRE